MRARTALLIASVLAACGGADKSSQCKLPADGTVLAIGDSITRGHGADGEGYPEQLQALLEATPARAAVRVVNQGVDGEQSAELLARLDIVMGATSPKVVLITIGGNDLLRKVDERAIRTNLAGIVEHVRAAGAWPILFAVPRPTVMAAAGLGSDHVMYEELAESTGTRIIADVVGDVLAKDELRSDEIHPNKQGYAVMAQAAFEALAECR
jgi:acyl-CoA thioesterase-1